MPKNSHAKSSKKRAKKKVLPLTQENVKLMEDYNKKLEKKISLLQLRADLSKEIATNYTTIRDMEIFAAEKAEKEGSVPFTARVIYHIHTADGIITAHGPTHGIKADSIKTMSVSLDSDDLQEILR